MKRGATMRGYFFGTMQKLLGKHLDLRVRLFNLLALTGAAISIAMAAAALFTRAGIWNILLNLLVAALSFALLYYSYSSGKYQRCYIITVVGIFLVFFPLLFFSSGGYRGGMPSFFIFAVLFTTFMLEGAQVYVLTAAEILLYTGLCIYAYFFPHQINQFDTEQALLIDILVGVLTVCITLGATMILHFRLYNAQQRQLEEAREEAIRHSEVKTAFLANMSHEIRTPINVILGMNEMILREGATEQIAEYSNSIQSAGRTLLTLVNNILDVSKIESGKLEVIEEEYLLQDLIHDLVIVGRERAEKKSLQFIVQAQESLPRACMGDFIHIKQIISNYISNAVKYTREGAVTLHFGGEAQDDGRYLLRISVVDTGPGIRKEHLPHLFEAFTRADLPAHRDIEGTGLGLAIAKQLSELLGGTIQAESNWGLGSEFGLEISQHILDSSPMGPWDALLGARIETRAEGFIAPKARVLIVDDNRENLQVVKSLLSRTLVQVDTAASGQACLEMVRQAQYHLLLMDFMMPDMDGIETLRHLRAEIPGFHAPVVALTATAVAGIEQVFLAEGFAAYLAKPVTWQALEDTLLQHLPAALLLREDGAEAAPVSAQVLQSFAEELLPYGIRLEEGLRYLSGDLLQYGKLAEFFTENYAESLREVRDLHAQHNFERLLYPIHALKSKAKSIGAANLAATAARMEARCAEQDSQYMQLAMPLLLLEWERAYEGMRALTARLGAQPGVPVQAPPPSGAFDGALLLSHLSAYRRRDAGRELQRAIAQAKDARTAAVLRQIQSAVQALEFEEAIDLYHAFSGDGRDPRKPDMQD